MKIIISENSGFCFGVKRAMDKTLELANSNNNKIYTFGPLIHNNQVIKYLEEMNVFCAWSMEEALEEPMIVRSHGIPLADYQRAKKLNVEIIDATCPYVRKVQQIAKAEFEKGRQVVILGNSSHPEVIGINGWCNNSAIIINDESNIDSISNYDKISVVAQTTLNIELWNRLSGIIKGLPIDVQLFNTICSATRDRQKACVELSKIADTMLIIGGYHSSNTQKLFELSKKYCSKSHHIETAEQLDPKWIENAETIGISAGASTPDWVINNVVKKIKIKVGRQTMENENMMNEMLEEIEKSLRVPRRGEILKAKVVQISDDEVVVNIGYKSDGIIPKRELTSEEGVNLKDILNEDDEIEVMVMKSDDGEGNVLLSRKRVDALKQWDDLKVFIDEGKPVTVSTKEVVKGGIIAYFGDIRGFIPASHLSLNYVSNLSAFVNEELEVKIIEFNKEKRNVVFSRKEVLEQGRKKELEALWGELEVGQKLQGKVKRLAKFGAFVDIGGVDGLVHISELSWGRIKNPGELLKVGDDIEVVIIGLDKENNKISLSLKQILPDPWSLVNTKYNTGDVINGRVVNLTDFGAFVEIEPGLEGLVHISQISKEHVKTTSDALKVNEEVEVKILGIDKEKQRISLSIKDATEEDVVEEEPSKESEEEESDNMEIPESVKEETITIKDMLESKQNQ
ncbi:MAG TPA: bifunctional 4-hydroxy-3-methylbut-2-enyl diphosphate reductase/30S ribosomal protein S1 [Clostridia bacterium]|nr:bifunctional 4-hydroxy-3-methylbut-2-enyl diphosphate reductase/30S ribosomal protein S1 [Clostridia bacterium]